MEMTGMEYRMFKRIVYVWLVCLTFGLCLGYATLWQTMFREIKYRGIEEGWISTDASNSNKILAGRIATLEKKIAGLEAQQKSAAQK